jgi:hypothetical protein
LDHGSMRAMNEPRPRGIALVPDRHAASVCALRAFFRFIVASARARIEPNGQSPAEIAAKAWPYDRQPDLLMRGAVTSHSTTDTASAIAPITAEYLDAMVPLSAAAHADHGLSSVVERRVTRRHGIGDRIADFCLRHWRRPHFRPVDDDGADHDRSGSGIRAGRHRRCADGKRISGRNDQACAGAATIATLRPIWWR